MSTTKRLYAKPYDDIKTPFTIDERGAFAEFIVQDPENLSDEIALGGTILILDRRRDRLTNQYSKFWIAGRVVGLRAISPFNPERESMLYQDEENESPYEVLEEISGGPHHHQPMVIRVGLDHELETPDQGVGFLVSPIQRPPSSFSRLFIPEMLEAKETGEPTLKEILSIKSKGVTLGYVGSGNSPFYHDGLFLPYKLDVDSLENKHTFIVGESGSGKTVFLKNLAFGIRRLNHKNKVTMVDVQGDIVQLALREVDDIVLKPRMSWQENILKTDADLNPEFVEKQLSPIRVIIPKSSEGHPSKNISALKLLCKQKNIEVLEFGLRLQDLHLLSDVEYLMRINSQQAVTLLDQFCEVLDKREVTITNLKRQIDAILKKYQGPTITSPKTGTTYYRSSFEAAQRALDALSKHFDYDEDSLNQVQNPLDIIKQDGTNIMYLADLNHEQRLMWEMQVLKWLNDNNDSINKEGEGETYVFFDEAHQIIPSRPIGIADKETFDRLRSNFERLSREGRKFGINLILSTQSPKDLHEIVPDQCPNKVVMKINPRNAQYAFLEPELAMIASRFNYGQFWFQSPFNGTPNWLRIHSAAIPLPHMSVKKFWPNIRKAVKL